MPQQLQVRKKCQYCKYNKCKYECKCRYECKCGYECKCKYKCKCKYECKCKRQRRIPRSKRDFIYPVGEYHDIQYPVKAVYLGYTSVNPIDVAIRQAVDDGYNLIVLAFWISPEVGVDPYSAAYWWSLLSEDTQMATIEYVHSKSSKVIVSLGGSSYGTYPSDGAVQYGTLGANFAIDNYLDGVDFDMENFTNTFGTWSGLNKTQTIQWLADASRAARDVLGTNAVVTHAPQSPYFNIEFANGYFDFYVFMKDYPGTINLYLIQYYNQGATYLNYTSQFINDDNYHPDTAVAQLINRGIDKTVIVVGKLTQAIDGQAASWVDPVTIGQWVAQAATDPATSNWTTGISTWQWNTNGNPTSAAWIAAVYP